MPITLQFGPWSPDLANDPIQIPDTQGPVPIACADVLNVFYANGSYKSIPSPAPAVVNGSTVQPLSDVALNAYSYFDYVQQQQTVFAGTPSGIQLLNADGSWSTISFLTNQTTTLSGQSLSFSIGNFVNANRLKSLSAKFAVGKFNTSVLGLSFVAGTATYQSGVTTGGQGQDIPIYNTVTGFNKLIDFPSFGSCAHPAILAGGTMVELMDSQKSPPVKGARFAVSIPVNPGQSGFATIKANGKTYTSASATYAYGNGIAIWNFPSAFGFVSGSTYIVTLT